MEYKHGDDFEYGEVTATFLEELQEQLDEKEREKNNKLIRVARSHDHDGERDYVCRFCTIILLQTLN